MNTLLPQIPRTEVTGLDLAMGVLTINQAAAQLAEFFTADPILQTWRLICRGSLPVVQVADEWRVPLDALKSFLVNGAANAQMRKELGLPAETVAPIFPWSGQWYDQTLWHYPIMQMLAGLSNEISKQLPATPDDVLALAARAKLDPRDNLNVNAEITPLMASLLLRRRPGGRGHLRHARWVDALKLGRDLPLPAAPGSGGADHSPRSPGGFPEHQARGIRAPLYPRGTMAVR